MNSTTKIQVDMTLCRTCEKTFFEFNDNELLICPQCNADLKNGMCDVKTTLDVELEVDWKTGKVTTIC